MSIKTILISTLKKSKEIARELGCLDYIQAPSKLEELEETIEKVLKAKRGNNIV